MNQNEISYILASGSPRRRELLTQIGIEYTVLPAKGEEVITTAVPGDATEELSRQKAREVFERITGDPQLQKEYFANKKMIVVIGADTVVSYKNKILGKPKNREDAAQTLKMLSGDVHQAITGVTVIWMDLEGNRGNFSFHSTTDVHFAEVTEEEIASYLATGDADDKAGSYGIQGLFGRYVTEIRGEFANVMGLPVAALYASLKKNHLI